MKLVAGQRLACPYMEYIQNAQLSRDFLKFFVHKIRRLLQVGRIGVVSIGILYTIKDHNSLVSLVIVGLLTV